LEAAAGSWLAADDRTNNLILSRLHAARFSDGVKSWLAMEGDAPQLALLETPLDLVLSAGSVQGAEFLTDNLEVDVRQFVGPAKVADAFAARLQRKTGRAGSMSMEMTFYTLDRVTEVSSPAGCMRAATRAELDELAPLAVAAEREMGVHAEERNPAEIESTTTASSLCGRRAQAFGRWHRMSARLSTVARAFGAYLRFQPFEGAGMVRRLQVRWQLGC
jgi:hypothetical protein